MLHRTLNTLVLIPAFAALALTSACTLNTIPIGALRTESQSVDQGAATSVRTSVMMGVGKLNVTGGSNSLMAADFTYNVESWKPIVNYNVSGSQAELTVQQPSVGNTGIPTGNVRYEWSLKFKNDVPQDMTVDLGAGEANLNLRDLTVRTLTMRAGAGSAVLSVPAQALSRLDVTGGAGNLTLDLTGDWKNNLSGSIKAGVGSVTLRLPRNAGVRVHVEGALGTVNATGLRKSGIDYTNDAANATAALDLTVSRGVGTVNLELAD